MTKPNVLLVRIVFSGIVCATLCAAFGCAPKNEEPPVGSSGQYSTSTQSRPDANAPSGGGTASGGVSDPSNAMNNPNVPAADREKIRQMMSSQGSQQGGGNQQGGNYQQRQGSYGGAQAPPGPR